MEAVEKAAESNEESSSNSESDDKPVSSESSSSTEEEDPENGKKPSNHNADANTEVNSACNESNTSEALIAEPNNKDSETIAESDVATNEKSIVSPFETVAVVNTDETESVGSKERHSNISATEIETNVSQMTTDSAKLSICSTKAEDSEAMDVERDSESCVSLSEKVDSISKDGGENGRDDVLQVKDSISESVQVSDEQKTRDVELMEVELESETVSADKIDNTSKDGSKETDTVASNNVQTVCDKQMIKGSETMDVVETEFEDDQVSPKRSAHDEKVRDIEVMDVIESESDANKSIEDKTNDADKDTNKIDNPLDITDNTKTVDISQDEDPFEIITDKAVANTPSKVGDKAISNADGGESILPDTGKSVVNDKDDDDDIEEIIDAESSEQYVVTNTTKKTSYVCMQCNKTVVPKYACIFQAKTSYICTVGCLDDLKEKKPGKVIVRGLRVKVFTSNNLSCRTPAVAAAAPAAATALVVPPPTSSDINVLSQRCKECNKSIITMNYFTWNTHTYCNDACLAIFQKLAGVCCVQCDADVPENLLGKYSVRFGEEIKQFCKNSCLLDHKKGLKFCSLCQAQIVDEYRGFCSVKCFEVHSSVKKPKSGSCAVCLKGKVEIEYEDDAKVNMFCGDPCFVAYKFVKNVSPLQCEFCKTYKPEKNVTCSFSFNGIAHHLCSKDCQKLFIIMNRKIVHCLWCNVKKYNFDMIEILRTHIQLVVCSLNCYNLYQSMQSRGCDFCHKNVLPLFHITTLDAKLHNLCSACLSLYKEKFGDSITADATTKTQVNGTEPSSESKKQVKKIVIVKPRPIPKQRNISTMCKPYQVTKSINCKPKEVQKGCQTEEFSNKFFLPVPVPIYVPAPLHMYAQPIPMPMPFPLPIPVPIFIPTTRKSANGILKEINKIKNKVPADPLEAELLMMAEMVAGDKKDDTDSESEDDAVAKDFPSEPLDTNNSFGEDVLQMALKMASDFEEPADLEGAVSTSAVSSQPGQDDSSQRIESIMDTKRKSIRHARQGRRKQQSQSEVFPPPPPVQPVELEKPDANMCLKYTFGVNAWKQWVTTKNLELQKTSKRVKLFKNEILQLTADELNFSLCLFVKEVRKPNGTEYAPDTIYYLCLGIQQYLYENGRIDNIFCDTFYEKFTDCLNEVCRKFSLLYNESQYIVTRVEEEHLWESKQLGAHSPLVLLNTLMFFNTKHFSLTTVDEHLQLSFSHIMKHWKRNPNQPGARNVLLRFYPPQTSEGPRKKKVYEQQENEDNPLRCPVKLYEFYLSKCPESVKTRNDVFYLQPERSCVPDSPVWYSTMALGKEPLEKMLNRVKMVKEINVALLTT